MYVKIVTIIRKENEWIHGETAIHHVESFIINDLSEPGSRTITLKFPRPQGESMPIIICNTPNEKYDVYIENDKGDTIGRY